jgi:2-polyprenyl-3-methyl-5-hydroxy-6-metoxy-1,4-benzoquinol methylase
MAVSAFENVKRFFIRLGVGLMPYFPLPWEPYRKALVRDSEKRYASGRWDYMNDIAEAHRYSIIAGCCAYFTPSNRRVLDVGCGEGILQQRMASAEYVGVDMNAAAIAKAQARGADHATFVVADAAQGYQASDSFDAIVFNESLYYIRDPAEVFARYRQSLSPDGIMVVCMFQTYLARQLWRKLRSFGMEELTTVKLSNELGFSSVIRVYANRRLPARPT